MSIQNIAGLPVDIVNLYARFYVGIMAAIALLTATLVLLAIFGLVAPMSAFALWGMGIVTIILVSVVAWTFGVLVLGVRAVLRKVGGKHAQ